jgi:hypothetical protein
VGGPVDSQLTTKHRSHTKQDILPFRYVRSTNTGHGGYQEAGLQITRIFQMNSLIFGYLNGYYINLLAK